MFRKNLLPPSSALKTEVNDVSERLVLIRATCHRNSEQFKLGRKHIKHLILVSIKIIIIRHVLGLNRHVSASSNSLFKDLPRRLRPFGL
jgi:hypothetical protein